MCNSHIMRRWKIKFAHKCLVFARVCLICVFWSDFNHIICAEAECSDIRLCQHHNYGHGEPPATKWCPWWRDCKKSALSALQSETSRMCNCTRTTMVKWMCVYGGGNVCVCSSVSITPHCRDRQCSTIPPLLSCRHFTRAGGNVNQIWFLIA